MTLFDETLSSVCKMINDVGKSIHTHMYNVLYADCRLSAKLYVHSTLA